MALRIVLMGTGEFAVPPFRAVLDSRHTVVGVVTQPDRTGRGHHRHVNPVKEIAEARGVPVLQPERVNRPEVLDQLKTWEADVFLVAAYGQILKPSLLSIPRLGAFNLHGSLLPRHRGAAPVQYAIWKGDARTGVTIFQIEPALDSGPMVGKVETDIRPEETSGELMVRLAELCIPMTLECCDALEAGTVAFIRQDESRVTLAPRLEKGQGIVNWNSSAQQIDCHVRAMQPWPRASTWLQTQQHPAGLRCLLLKVRPLQAEDGSMGPGPLPPAVTGGTGDVAGDICVSGERMFVRCGRDSRDVGWIEILSIQPEGRRAMDAAAFCHGYAVHSGARFCSELKG